MKKYFEKYIAQINTLKMAILPDLIMLILSFGAFCAIQNLSRLPIKPSMKYWVCNIIVLYTIYKLLYLLINRLWISTLLADIILYAFAVGNYYTNEFRGVMILPWDLFSLNTAADVASGYEYHFFAAQFIWLFVITIVTYAIYLLFPKSLTGKNRITYAVCSVLICIVLTFGMINSEIYKSIPDRLYLVERYYKNQGIPVSFFNYCKFLYTKAPDGYSVAKTQELAEKYKDGLAKDSDLIVPDNVIVIMNESFSDFSVIGSIPETEEAMSVYQSIAKNSVYGNLYVPVFGGTTVNSEYEFLTGNSVAFLKGCPFSYAVRENRPSVARIFSDLGYEVHAFHPADPKNWNRKSVYPYLGMQEFLSLDDLEESSIPKVNDHMLDTADYENLIKLYENKKSDKFFAFNVTMQNHSGYDFDFKADTGIDPVDLSAYGEYTHAENYLSLLKLSSEAIGELTDYFSKVEEPTLICVFGDHQPSVGDEFYTLLDADFDPENPEDNIKKYTTPFMIWTNYQTEGEYYEKMSSNYLSGLLLEKCNIDTAPYYNLMRVMRDEYPVLSTNGVYDKDGNFYKIEDVTNNDLIKDYQYFQYNNAVEKTDSVIWPAYIRE